MLEYLRKSYKDIPTWLFFFSTFVHYVAMGVVYPLFDVPVSLLFLYMHEELSFLPLVWGVSGLLSNQFGLLGWLLKKRWMIWLFSVVQVSLWGWAVGVYFSAGLVFLGLAHALPHLLFWAWNHTVQNAGMPSIDKHARAV